MKNSNCVDGKDALHGRLVEPNQMTATGKLLKTTQAAAYLGVSRWTIYDLVRDGRLRPIVGLKSWRFTVEDLDSVKWERL